MAPVPALHYCWVHRHWIKLAHGGVLIGPAVFRLSDLLFVLARLENLRANTDDVEGEKVEDGGSDA